MLVPDQKIEVEWGKANKNRYISMGYTYTKIGDTFWVKVEDLPQYSDAKVKVICDYCGKEFEMTYSHYLRSIKTIPKIACKNCSGLKHSEITLHTRQEDLYQSALKYCDDNGYTLLSNKEDLLSNQSVVKFVCPIHGIQEKTITSMRQGKKCKLCANETRGKKSQAHWNESLNERASYYYDKCLKTCQKNGYELLSKPEELFGYKAYVVYKCPKHGVHKMQVGNLLNGRKCPECQRHSKQPHINDNYKRHDCRLKKEEVINRIEGCGGIVLNPEDYVNTTKKNLNIVCPVCGEIFITSLRDFTQHGGQACQNCSKKMSVGERHIRDYLDNHAIVYEAEKWFPDCRDVNPLPFDFYLPEQNYIIEFDGEQHFKENHFFDSVEIGYIKRHDEIKTQYCKDNNINLLRIPYTQLNNIDQILDEKLTA